MITDRAAAAPRQPDQERAPVSRRLRLAATLVGLLLALLACRFPAAIAESQTPPGEPTSTQTFPTPPVTTAPEGASPAATTCRYQARFVQDVTVPDDSPFRGGTSFTKTWRLRNVGTCSWDPGFQLVFVGGDGMSGLAFVPLPRLIAPQDTVDLSIDLIAPEVEGTHRGEWMIQTPSGELFGIGAEPTQPFWVQIIVGPTPTPVEGEPGTHRVGKVDVPERWTVDLDAGRLGPAEADADLLLAVLPDQTRALMPQNGAAFVVWRDGVPDYEACQTAPLSTEPIPLADLAEGDLMCYRTGEERPGRLEIEHLTAGTLVVATLDFRTWSIP